MTEANSFSDIKLDMDSKVNKDVTTYRIQLEGTLNA